MLDRLSKYLHDSIKNLFVLPQESIINDYEDVIAGWQPLIDNCEMMLELWKDTKEECNAMIELFQTVKTKCSSEKAIICDSHIADLTVKMNRCEVFIAELKTQKAMYETDMNDARSKLFGT